VKRLKIPYVYCHQHFDGKTVKEGGHVVPKSLIEQDHLTRLSSKVVIDEIVPA